MLIVITIFVSFLVFIGFHMMPSQSKKSTEYNIISVHEVTVNHEVYTCVCLAAVKTMLVLFECFFSFTKGMATNFYCYTYCIYVTCLQINTYFCRPETQHHGFTTAGQITGFHVFFFPSDRSLSHFRSHSGFPTVTIEAFDVANLETKKEEFFKRSVFLKNMSI